MCCPIAYSFSALCIIPTFPKAHSKSWNHKNPIASNWFSKSLKQLWLIIKNLVTPSAKHPQDKYFPNPTTSIFLNNLSKLLHYHIGFPFEINKDLTLETPCPKWNQQIRFVIRNEDLMESPNFSNPILIYSQRFLVDPLISRIPPSKFHPNPSSLLAPHLATVIIAYILIKHWKKIWHYVVVIAWNLQPLANADWIWSQIIHPWSQAIDHHQKDLYKWV